MALKGFVFIIFQQIEICCYNINRAYASAQAIKNIDNSLPTPPAVLSTPNIY